MKNFPNITFFFVLLSIALITHFQTSSYIYWDEWDVLRNFHNLGIKASFNFHNEHFIPVFFIIYYLESLVFGDLYSAYLVVSLLLLSGNAFLLFRLFISLANDDCQKLPLSHYILPCLYIVSAIHSEIVDWAFVQCILFSQLLVFIALLSLLSYAIKPSLKHLCCYVLSIFFAPFFFGNGFNVIIQISAFCFIFLINKQNYKKIFFLLAIALIASLCSFIIYKIANTFLNVHHNHLKTLLNSRSPIEHLRGISLYVFVGSQLGAILRGFGIYQSLELAPIESILPYFTGDTSKNMLINAYLGLTLSMGILYLSTIKSKHWHRNMCLWFFGQSIIIANLLLPALGRWQIAIFQSLALRYHSSALIGSCFVILPLMLRIEETIIFLKDNGHKAKTLALQSLTYLVIIYYCLVNLQISYNFNYFTDKGLENRRFINEFLQARSRICNSEKKEVVKNPKIPPHLNPGANYQRISEVLQFLGRLDKKQCPLDDK